MIRPLSPAEGLAGPAPEPGPPAAAGEDLAGYLRYLEGALLSDSLVHRQTLPPRPARHAAGLSHLGEGVARVLAAAGVERLWSHQEEGIGHLRAGRDVVVATPTASGKTLVYNAAVLADLLDQPSGFAVYVFPLKALAQDQLDELRGLLAGMACGLTAEIYDGDTRRHVRDRIRRQPPNILITTPDMLHSGLLAFHEAWEEVWRNLRWVVVDELHTYNGIFGSHVLHLFRRLDRLCASHGAEPRYVTCSATVGNPRPLAEGLFGRPFTAVTRSGAPAAARHFLIADPAESPNTVAARLLQSGVRRRLRSIVFTRARVTAELIYRWATDHRPELRERISSYRAGYLPEERRQIESRLIAGDLLGVVSTSALELGIDIGGLDVCVLVGYPGSIVGTWQRAGRVGRQGRESLVVLLAGRDALDQYFARHPEQLFGRGIEDAVADPCNRYVLEQHLPCAARELPLTRDEPAYAALEGYGPALERLTDRGELLQSAEGDAWFASRKRPHRRVNMRAIGESWSIVEGGGEAGGPAGGGRAIGTVSGGQLHAECHEGAIYLHRGRQYLIGGRHPAKRQIDARVVDVSYYTRPKREKETEILEELACRPMHGYQAKLGRLLVRSQVTAFEKVRAGDQAVLSRHPLDSPVESFETVGFWLEMDAPFKKQLKRRGHHHMGSLHAVEHAAKSIFPLLALSKSTDVGGICYPLHPQLRKGAIFVYDHYPGGIGLAEKGFEMLDRLLELTLGLVEACDCEEGCPSCIHFPTCGAGNHPLDKAGCTHLLELLSGRARLDAESLEVDGLEAEPPLFADWESDDEGDEPDGTDPEEHVVVFDLETQLSAAEVGGWNRTCLMRVSCGILWDSRGDEFVTYFEDGVPRLIEHLRSADLVVGFNCIGFDYSVLRGYTRFDFRDLATLDMLREIRDQLNFRVSLDSLAQATLEEEKTADGLQALRWWKEGRLDLIEEYCRNDVRITRDIWRFGRDHGYLLFDRRGEGRMRVPVDFRERVTALR